MEFQGTGQTNNNADVVTQLQGIAQQLSALVEAFQGRFVSGAFTMAAAATTAVSDVNIAGNSVILLIPTNAAAATLVGGTKSPYVSARSVGVSFTVATASGVAAAGTETFNYLIFSPT